MVGMNLDFRLKLLVVTHDQGHSGKMDRFGVCILVWGV